MIVKWTIGLLKTRFGRLLGTIAGIAVAVALLADLGLFLEQSSASMTVRSLRAVTMDWQVELRPGTDFVAVADQIRSAAKVATIDTVGYADIDAFELKTGDSVQATAAGKAVGLRADYFTRHAGDVRLLSGDLTGAVLLQQTAANLHAQAGDIIAVKRPGAPDVKLAITGVIDLKSADSFFQAIGVPPGAAPQAPPDNAVLMPDTQWSQLFGPQVLARPDSVHQQLHVAIDRASLPTDPNEAFAFTASEGRNFEARAAGSATLSNNLAAQLDAARGDSLYAKVLFLFLGLPGAILATLLTFAIALSGMQARRQDLALLKLRGASPAKAITYIAAEAGLVGASGSVVGLVVGLVAAVIVGGLTVTAASSSWLIGCALLGLMLGGLTILLPAFWSTSTQSFTAARVPSARRGPPLWERLYVDVLCLALAGLVFWKTSATGYQVVLATEGVTATSVDYTAFLAPVLVWIGAGLLIVRLSRLFLQLGRPMIARSILPLAGTLAPAVAAAVSRQRARIAVGVALTALAIAFLASTAIFNATYEGQARVDAELTNGADVAVTGSASSPAGALLADLRKIPGVADAEPMQHRYAYVGTDLQDLYGIDASRISSATTVSNAFFANGNAKAVLALLSARPDAVLVSEETVNDFQLALGDPINLRLQGADHAYHVVPFVFSGVVREFPTAPRDSFLVANADYIAKVTGTAAAEIVLMRTSLDPARVKASAQDSVAGKGMQVSSVDDVVHIIGSSLSAVDLKGLSQIELTFAVMLAVGATALVLALGFADRRRDFAILKVLGSSRRALASFVWVEAGFVVTAGVVAGALVGTLVAQILIKVLEGVFDPPPEAMSAPFGYLAVSLAAILIATGIAVVNAVNQAARDPLSRLREQQ